jgi:hypothetical protein
LFCVVQQKFPDVSEVLAAYIIKTISKPRGELVPLYTAQQPSHCDNLKSDKDDSV